LTLCCTLRAGGLALARSLREGRFTKHTENITNDCGSAGVDDCRVSGYLNAAAEQGVLKMPG